MLYRGMDRAQLDAAYNNSAAVPERDAIVAGWAARSARVRRECAGHFDLAYGETPAMTMPRAEVCGGIAISGIYDLEPIRLNYLNEKLGLDAAEAERNSPVRDVPANASELVVAYGTRELPELCRQSIEYAQAWTKRGLPGRLLPVDGADHFTILTRWRDQRVF